MARWLAIATVVVAIAGVAFAPWARLLREQDVRVNDLEAVRGWYAGQFRRRRLVRMAGLLLARVLLACGVLLAGLTGLGRPAG